MVERLFHIQKIGVRFPGGAYNAVVAQLAEASG